MSLTNVRPSSPWRKGIPLSKPEWRPLGPGVGLELEAAPRRGPHLVTPTHMTTRLRQPPRQSLSKDDSSPRQQRQSIEASVALPHPADCLVGKASDDRPVGRTHQEGTNPASAREVRRWEKQREELDDRRRFWLVLVWYNDLFDKFMLCFVCVAVYTCECLFDVFCSMFVSVAWAAV